MTRTHQLKILPLRSLMLTMWNYQSHCSPEVLIIFSASENQTAIGTVTATDTDTDDSLLVFSVSGSELMITSGGLLTFANAPDYETKTSYSATVTVTDGTNSSTQDITVTITDVDDTARGLYLKCIF